MTKKSNTFGVRHMYQESKLKEKIEYKLYKEIWDVFSKHFVNECTLSGNGYILPHKLGVFQIRKKRTVKGRKRIDFKKTLEYGMTIYHSNRHTDGYYGMWYWNKTKPYGICSNKHHFKFELVRKNKRFIAKQIKESNTIINYLELN